MLLPLFYLIPIVNSSGEVRGRRNIDRLPDRNFNSARASGLLGSPVAMRSELQIRPLRDAYMSMHFAAPKRSGGRKPHPIRPPGRTSGKGSAIVRHQACSGLIFINCALPRRRRSVRRTPVEQFVLGFSQYRFTDGCGLRRKVKGRFRENPRSFRQGRPELRLSRQLSRQRRRCTTGTCACAPAKK